MKSLFDWHALYALIMDIQNNLEPWVCTIIGIYVGISDGLSARTRPRTQAVHRRLGAKAVGHP